MKKHNPKDNIQIPKASFTIAELLPENKHKTDVRWVTLPIPAGKE